MSDTPLTSKERVYRDALTRIRDELRSDPADFETAVSDLRMIYTLANNVLADNGDLFARAAVEPPVVRNEACPGDGICAPDGAGGCVACDDGKGNYRPAPPPSAWQPIKTAPKDGRQIVAIGLGQPFFARWGDGANCWIDVTGHERSPSYWMPAPEGPNVAGASSTKDDGLWNPFGNDGMRRMENADVIGGATDETSEHHHYWRPVHGGFDYVCSCGATLPADQV